MKQLKGKLMLLTTAIIWGGGFIAQSLGMDLIGPWTFTCLRNIVGGITLLVLMPLLDKTRSISGSNLWDNKVLIIGGIACGCALCAAGTLQTIGIKYTTVAKAGFITTLYVILVPIFSIVLGKRVRPLIWLSAIIAIIGLYFLSMNESFSLSYGDTYVLISSVLFAVHIMIIEHYSPKVDGVRLSCIQFFVAGLLCIIPMLLIEKPTLGQISNAFTAILYSGMVSSGIGYTLQIVGQKDVDPTSASLILSLESVVAVLMGYVFLNQGLTMREVLGCVIMFVAIIIAQLPEKQSG